MRSTAAHPWHPPAKGQDGHFVVGQFDEFDFTAMSRQSRIDFAVERVIDAIFERTVGIDLGHFGIRGLDGQLTTHAVGVEIDHRFFQKGKAVFVEKNVDFLEFEFDVSGLFFTRTAVRQASFCVGSAGLSDENADGYSLDVLFFRAVRRDMFVRCR